jgi:hypothetical protein
VSSPFRAAASYAVGMQLTEMSVMGFRTSVIVFRRPAGGLRWVIIPTIHMGHADYYWAIWQRLRSCQAVVRREELLLGVMREIDGEFAAEDMEVAVVFGALHMPTFVRELTGKLGYRVMPGARALSGRPRCCADVSAPDQGQRWTPVPAARSRRRIEASRSG